MNETILSNQEAQEPAAEEEKAPVANEEQTPAGEQEDPKPQEAAEEKDGDAVAGKDSEKADEPEGAPDTYEDFKFAEGIEADEAQMAEAVEVFKDLNLTQEQAQKLVDFDNKRAQQAIEAQAKAWEDTVNKWEESSKKDGEFGGDKFDESVSMAVKARDAFGSDAFNDMLDATGVGSHPEMLRFMIAVGKAISDDKILHGGQNSGGDKDPAKVMFPTMN